MEEHRISRRTLLGSAALAAGAMLPHGASAGANPEGEDFSFEVQRTEEEWREMLTEDEYNILRGGGTEPKRSSPFWDDETPGLYFCKGCDLTLFDTHWKVNPDIGWVFFRQCEPVSIVTAIDRPDYAAASAEGAVSTMAPELSAEELRALDSLAGIEAICRRCGSHLGHVVPVKGRVLYCINGSAMTFKPSAT